MNTAQILIGDCREMLKTLADESVNCCVTSPPYWGLRDYGTAEWSGGDAICDHKARPGGGGASASTLVGTHNRGGFSADGQYRGVCAKCGAIRTDCQIGLESTPAEYVETMVTVFRDVRRVLKKDGALWLNLGDSYCSTDKWGGGRGGNTGKHTVDAAGGVPSWACRAKREAIPGIKPKDLVGIPWMTAFALRADGWYLRQDIIWHKPNPMPESVTDRCTKSHEYIFLLSKSQTYFYDHEAIKEQAVSNHDSGNGFEGRQGGAQHLPMSGGEGSKEQWRANGRTGKTAMRGQGHFRETEGGPTNREGRDMADVDANADGRRNKRSVWTVNSKPYKEAHFATYPPELIQPCILAGCPAGGVVLDPFGGSGTTGQVAVELGRSAILIELNPEYAKLASVRTDVTPGFPALC